MVRGKPRRLGRLGAHDPAEHSGEAIVIDVALYFREQAAIIGPANPQGLGYSGTQAFGPEVPRALERHGVKLPDCDTAHRKPCMQEQLDP